MSTSPIPVRSMSGKLLLAGCCVLTFACAAASPQTQAREPNAVAETIATPEPESTTPAPTIVHVENPLAPANPAYPPPPTSCLADVHPVDAETSACGTSPIDVLDAALALTDPNARDAALRELQPCQAWPVGWVLALRAELQPVECADALIAPWFERRVAARLSEPVRLDVEHVLVGMAIAARLRRLQTLPPVAPANGDKRAFAEFFEQRLRPWVLERAKAIHELSLLGSKLQGYGRGIVAVEAAVADLEFVQMARDVELPQDMKGDVEVSNAYYAALDEALEPRKMRGRDAALAGLDEFARLGVVSGERIERARKMLARSYAGHRITALDGLLLPPLPPPSELSNAAQRLAATLPSFFTDDALSSVIDVRDAPVLRALIENGLSPKLRRQLDEGPLTLEASELYARFLVALGQRYFRSAEFARAARLTSNAPTAGQRLTDAAQLIRALALALEHGPKDAREMIVGGPLLPDGVGNVAALDQLSEERGQLGGLASYDAAYVLALLPPLSEPKRFWGSIAERYERAATKLESSAARERAAAAAKIARQTAAAIPP